MQKAESVARLSSNEKSKQKDTLRRCTASVKTGKTAQRKSIAGKKAKETDGSTEINDKRNGLAKERDSRANKANRNQAVEHEVFTAIPLVI